MKLSIKAIRFALIPPAAAIVWLLVAVIGICFEARILPIFCPEGFGSGKDCYAPYWPDLKFFVRLFFVGLSAIAVVFISLLMAPTKKIRTAVVVYVVGVSVATLLAFEAGWWFWLAAILSGLLPILLQHHVAGGGNQNDAR